MILEVISSHKRVFKGEAEVVTLPGVLGSFTVLKNHASLISVLTPGKIVYRETMNSEKHGIDIDGGIVDVDNNVISVCVY